MAYLIQVLKSWRDEEAGQALAEYGLILAFIAVVCVAALTLLGLSIAGLLGNVVSGFGGGS